MNETDKKIAETLAKFGEPMAGNVWRVQGNAVIYHKTLERIAAQAKITFDLPTIVRAETDEAVLLVAGRMGERMEWSIGEAVMAGGNHPGNYRVSGKQAAYPYAMAEKRAKDRVILKLIELHGLVYSEEEADEFKESARGNGGGEISSAKTTQSQDRAGSSDARTSSPSEAGQGQIGSVEAELKQKITKAKSINAVSDLMLHADTQKILNELPEPVRDKIRDFAKARLVELGWPTKKAQ